MAFPGVPVREALDSALMACQQAAVEGDAMEYARANGVFHNTIYDGSRNECLADQIRAARRQSERLSQHVVPWGLPCLL